MNVSVVEEFKRSWVTSTIGIILFFCGLWLLTWNEGRAVNHANSLDEAFNNVITINAFDKIQPEFEGRLVHINGPISTSEPLTEPDYGISIQAVKLKRRVQMYQWIEERTPSDYSNIDTVGHFEKTEDSHYYYVTEWRDKLVDSSNFYFRHGHENPFNELKQKFVNYEEVTGDERPERSDIKLHMGIYYHCDDVWNPEVGDIRVQFYYAGLIGEEVSIIGMQKDGVIVPYLTSKGHQILLLRHGILTVSQMFTEEHKDARIETWKLRGAGVAVLYASSICLTRLIRLLMLRSTILRSMALSESGSKCSFAVSLSVSLLIMSTAWIVYRPWLGAALLMAAFSPFIYSTLVLVKMVLILFCAVFLL
ncbi:transmembrane protein 43 homolog isoform X2 [Agrilus planipennis]|uniref:Transmembrane protein 43 homolog isoform X2 n=1 Tax=Agrilus planipennis TaxID=224129 RepID=A0A1W4XFW2_AGRPL|nr:transmembrane protein 43 homolog isoform X2 [Agrilus planipennis]